MNTYVILLLLLGTLCAYPQQIEIDNISYFEEFYNSNDKNLILLGENHSSSVASDIFPELIKYHNKKNGLRTLLLEFGPSEAYFYSKYLETGDEKYFGYTIYAGFYKAWKSAWRRIYEYNKTLDKPFEVRGVDFDRGRTFAYALYNIFKEYDDKPVEIDSLMNIIKTQEFYKKYTIGYPTKLDKKFITQTRELLVSKMKEIKDILTPMDLSVVEALLNNEVDGFGAGREMGMQKNVAALVTNSNEKDFFMLVGRDHAYKKGLWDDDDKLAKLLKGNNDFHTLTGVILHENSQQWDKDFKDPITLFDVSDKEPWMEFASPILEKADSDLTLIPLEGNMVPLNAYTDYILVAKNKGPIEF